jgi:hypothetical protein
MNQEDYDRAENMLETLRKHASRKSDEEVLAEIERARLLILRRMEEFKRIQRVGRFDFGMWLGNREYLDRLLNGPMTEEDYNKSANFLEALRKIRARTEDEAKLEEMELARELVITRRREYNLSRNVL